MKRPPAGILALVVFFGFGTTMSLLAALALLFPDTGLHALWRLNPAAQEGLASLGYWAIALMLAVSAACGTAAAGLWRGAAWGRVVAISVLVVNLLGDAANALLRGDWRTLIGVPIGAALIAYLRSARVRAFFQSRGAL